MKFFEQGKEVATRKPSWVIHKILKDVEWVSKNRPKITIPTLFGIFKSSYWRKSGSRQKNWKIVRNLKLKIISSTGHLGQHIEV